MKRLVVIGGIWFAALNPAGITIARAEEPAPAGLRIYVAVEIGGTIRLAEEEVLLEVDEPQVLITHGRRLPGLILPQGDSERRESRLIRQTWRVDVERSRSAHDEWKVLEGKHVDLTGTAELRPITRLLRSDDVDVNVTSWEIERVLKSPKPVAAHVPARD